MNGIRERLREIWRTFFRKKEVPKPRVEGIVEKLAIFIDGENLHNSLIEVGGLEIDNFGEFIRRLTEGKELARPPMYYTSVNIEDPLKTEKTLRLIDFLANQGFQIQHRPLSKGKEPKSEIDPLIAADICRAAINEEISTVILVSGDHHFVPAVIFAQEKGKKVKVVSTAASLSEELKRKSDQWIDLGKVIEGITRKPKIEEKRAEALEKLNEGKRIILPTFEEEP